MERKIVQHGPSTMMVSLPAKWIKKEVKKGDSLNIDEKGNYLIISIDKQTDNVNSEIDIDLSSVDEASIRTILTNIYRIGYNNVNIKYNDNMLDTIKTVVEKNLLGFEIIETKNNICKIESITEPSKDKFDNIFSKVFVNIDELFEIGEKILKGEKCEFEDRERKIQEFDNFCKRILVKDSFLENNFLSWSFHSTIIHATRELYHMYKYISKNKIKTSELELNLLQDCRNVFNHIHQSYIKKDITLLERLHEQVKKIVYENSYDVLNKSNHPIIIHHLITSIRHFYLANSPLIGMLVAEKSKFILKQKNHSTL